MVAPSTHGRLVRGGDLLTAARETAVTIAVCVAGAALATAFAADVAVLVAILLPTMNTRGVVFLQTVAGLAAIGLSTLLVWGIAQLANVPTYHNDEEGEQ